MPERPPAKAIGRAPAHAGLPPPGPPLPRGPSRVPHASSECTERRARTTIPSPPRCTTAARTCVAPRAAARPRLTTPATGAASTATQATLGTRRTPRACCLALETSRRSVARRPRRPPPLPTGAPPSLSRGTKLCIAHAQAGPRRLLEKAGHLDSLLLQSSTSIASNWRPLWDDFIAPKPAPARAFTTTTATARCARRSEQQPPRRRRRARRAPQNPALIRGFCQGANRIGHGACVAKVALP